MELWIPSKHIIVPARDVIIPRRIKIPPLPGLNREIRRRIQRINLQSLVQQAANSVAGGASVTATLGSNANSANILFAFCNTSSSLDPTHTVSGAGATWTSIADVLVSGSGRTTVWIGTTPTGTAVTNTFSNTANGTINASEFSGLSSTQDGTPITASGTSTTPGSGNKTTVNATDLILGVLGWRGTATLSGFPDANFTALTAATSGGGAPSNIAPEYRVVTSIGTFSANGILSASSAWEAIVLAYQASGGAATERHQTRVALSPVGFH